MIFAFIISFLSFAHINLGGEVYPTEIILLIYLIYSAGKLRLLTNPFPKKVILLGTAWLLSQMLTDWYRDSPPENYLRGWAAIIFFLIDFCALYIMVLLKPAVIRILLFGNALGIIFSIFLFPTDYSLIEPWKFGYGLPVTTLTLLYLGTGERYKSKIGLALLIGLGLFSIAMNARSLGALIFISAIFLYMSEIQGFKHKKSHRLSPVKLIGIFFVLLLTATSIEKIYSLAAESGLLPDNVTEKYEMNKTKNEGVISTILGGRSEVFISTQAVIDSPILGHGSWAQDSKYTEMRYDVAQKIGAIIDPSYLKYTIESTDLIPTHSAIMQAWVWAGILGAFFWLHLLFIIINNIGRLLSTSSKLKPLQFFFTLSTSWAVIFSPFGSDARFGFILSLMLLISGSKLLKIQIK